MLSSNRVNTMSYVRRKNNTPNLEFLNVDNDAATELRKELKSSRFANAESILKATTESTSRTYLLEAAADWSKTPSFIRKWASLGSIESQLVLAIHHTKLAWNLSSWTRGRADLAAFQNELQSHSDWLKSYCTSNPRDASVYYWRIWIARAQNDPDHARILSEQAFSIDPSNIANASGSLYTESAWWFGDTDKVLKHAEDLSRRMPADAHAASLIIEAHYLNQLTQQSGYWDSDSVREDILNSSHQNPAQPISTIADYRSAHWHAWGLSRIQRHAEAKDYFEHLRGAPPATPWGSMRFGLDALFSVYKNDRNKALA